MKKTRESIERKWRRMVEVMKAKADFKYAVLIENKKKKLEKSYEYEWERNEKRKAAYIKKKTEEYNRKMMNEIRELEWRPKRVYKSEWPKINPLEFAMKIAQENARLRDTDEEWNWRCISCDRYCTWWELAGWHRYSRRFSNMCLEEENINAQCHTCNRITWPLGNPQLKLITNNKYDENIDLKFGEGTSTRLKRLLMDSTSGKWVKYDLSKKIPELIERNEKLWEWKNFHTPGKKWRNVWEEYVKRHPEYEE